MSGLCSRHQHHEPGCRLCEADIREVLPDYDRKLAEARAAGGVECGACGFRFFRTTDTCPACSSWTWLDGGYRVQWPFHMRGDPRFGDRAWIGRFERVLE